MREQPQQPARISSQLSKKVRVILERSAAALFAAHRLAEIILASDREVLLEFFSHLLYSREFYYIQMDKFARQALAEGITSRDDIVVTVDSEIFRTLNQHYNRNNHVQPPESLVHVVQESLREFFDAIRLGKDAEPSWKKQIYKIINRLDDPIPEYFKDPNFLERLE
ncbi:hypothetical protein ANCCAN_23625 [Ancylostoma caninum]|uniref:Prospero domain-containing protein n=1 Tax=Ancylostoma caninum TaxID=29170 RepID=A0A368FHY4_ANCCA|nr:hypothetical protein ANCCAN_23625 [Ancylostoma caninum]